ncbi:MAG TPA: hypothetical protein VEV44_15820 [Pseudoneobacillus sp.]|nr:hypothetical protein [Pseudoneobacillus sp.]
MKKKSELDQLSFQRSVIREEYMDLQPHNKNSLSQNQYNWVRLRGRYRIQSFKEDINTEGNESV